MSGIEALLRRAEVWRGGEARALTRVLKSGFEALDTHVGGGWPLGALSELMPVRAGIGEVRLLLPALAALSRQARWIAWIAPPHIPYAPALLHHGVDLRRVLLVHPRDENEACWAAEQALRAGSCSAVLAWLKTTDARVLRRLQWAAETGASLGVVFRAIETPSSPAALRLRLEPVLGGGLAVHVLKRRGGWASGPVFLNLDETAVVTPVLTARRG